MTALRRKAIRIRLQNESHSRFQFAIQKRLTLKTYFSQFLFGISDLYGVEALQIGADRGGMRDDEGGFAIWQVRQDVPDTSRHSGIDFTERLAIRILEIRVFILPFPERNILPGRVTGFSFKKPEIGSDRQSEKLCSLESTSRGRCPDLRNIGKDKMTKNLFCALDPGRRKAGVSSEFRAFFRDGMPYQKESFHIRDSFLLDFNRFVML